MRFVMGALILALVLAGCVKKAPRNQGDKQSPPPEKEPAPKCGLICKIKKKSGKQGPKQRLKTEKKDKHNRGKKKSDWSLARNTGTRHKGKGVYHTVKKGETLWRICHTYRVDIKKVARANGLKDTTRIDVGQRIWIPDAKKVLKVPPAPASSAGSGWSGKGSPGPGRPSSATRGTLSHPVPGGVVTSRFGMRDGRMHEGIDISAAKGTGVLAADDGKVVYADDGIRSYGNMIIIKHAGNLTTVYAHNRVNRVKTGDLVKRGQKIAEVGQTGRASGPHLHFEVRVGEKPVNPKYYLP